MNNKTGCVFFFHALYPPPSPPQIKPIKPTRTPPKPPFLPPPTFSRSVVPLPFITKPN